MATWAVSVAGLHTPPCVRWRPRVQHRAWSRVAPAPTPAPASGVPGPRVPKVFSRDVSEVVVTRVWRRHLTRPRLDVRLRASSVSFGDEGDESNTLPKPGWVPDPTDARTRVEYPPHVHNRDGDALETGRNDERKARISSGDPGRTDDTPPFSAAHGSGTGPDSTTSVWPPHIGRGWVATVARAAWACVAAVGFVRAAVACFGAVALLLAPETRLVATTTTPGIALASALLESLAGSAQGALISMVLAPAAAALLATVFEIALRVSVWLAARQLPRTIAPATSKTEAQRARRAAQVAAGRDEHQNFARMKTDAHDACEARVTTAEIAFQEWTRPAVAAALVSAGVAAAAGSVRYGAGAVAAALFVEAALFACVAAAMSLLRRGHGAATLASVRDELAQREREFLLDQHRGTFSCRWRPDDYAAPGERNVTSADKALTNAAVAAAAAAAAVWRGFSPANAPCLVLDAADGRTSVALGAARATRDAVSGEVDRAFPPSAVFVPNQHTHVVHALRYSTPAINTPVAADIRDVLARRAPNAPPFHLVYLDHCGAVAQREQQLWDVFSRHAVADGGVLAVTFSTRGKRKGWSKATAVSACARALFEAADAHGYELMGGAADGGGCGSETGFDLSRLMAYAVRVGDAPGDETSENSGTNPGTNSAIALPIGPAAQMEAAQRAHAVAIETALGSYTRARDAAGGVASAFGAGGRQVDDESHNTAANKLATVLNEWAEDTPDADDGVAAMLDTWAGRRRRRMCGYVYSRVVLGKAVDDGENAKDIENGARGSTVSTSASELSDFRGTENISRVSPADARTLASLGREAAKAARAAAALATAPLTTASDLGTDLSRVATGEGNHAELKLERCFFLYGTLMFFVFRVRVKDWRGGWIREK